MLASSPIIPWQIERVKVEAMIDFVSLCIKIMGGDLRHEIKRHLLFGRKEVTNLDNTLKSRDIALLTNIWRVKAVAFIVVMQRHES